jgi:hypothetical protein
VPAALYKVWRVLADDRYAHKLALKHQSSSHALPQSYAASDVFWMRFLLGRLRPIPIFRPLGSWFDEAEGLGEPENCCDIKIELVGIRSGHEIGEFERRANDWQAFLTKANLDLTLLLREAMDWLSEFNMASADIDPTYAEFRSISQHEQNKHAPNWTILISLVRDSFDALLATGDTEAALRIVEYWRTLPYPIFRRLVLYAATCEAT